MTKYTHLSLEERTLISHYHDNGISTRKIGQLVGRSPSTVSRELSRNANQHDYKPKTAQNRYIARRQKPCKLDEDQTLKAYVLTCLHEGISPEMISIRLKEFGHLEGVNRISHESIYRWLYRRPQKDEKLYKLLIRHHGRRGRRKRSHRGKIKDRVSIHERPKHVMNRKEIGHWEADLMSFQGNRQHMLVLHERTSRYTMAMRLKNKTAQETVTNILGFVENLPKAMFKSITFDNGTEFAKHKDITHKLGTPTYFCDVYASWQKGGIENQNGRLRRDLPRQTNIKDMQENEFQNIINSHNLMPRKVLKGYSPIEYLAKENGKHIIFLFKNGVALHL